MFKSWQLSHKASKRIKILSILFIIGVVLWYLPILFFQFELGRKGGAKYLANELSESLNAEVELKSFELTFSGDVRAKGLSVKDSLKRELISARSIIFDLNLSTIWHFINNDELSLSHIRLFKPEITVREDSLGRLNIEQLFKKEEQEEKKSNKKFDLSIYSLLLREGSFKYYHQDSLIFGISNLETKIDNVNKNEEQGQEVSIRELSFRLSNGFFVKNLSSILSMKSDSLRVRDLDILFGNSQLNIPKLTIKNSRPLLKKIDSLDIAQINIKLSDLSAFHKKLDKFGDRRLRGRLKILNEDGELSLERLELSTDDNFNLQVNNSKIPLNILGLPIALELPEFSLSIKPELWESLKLISQKPLLDELKHLGACRLEAKGSFNNGEDIKLEAKLMTALAELNMKTDAKLRFSKLIALHSDLDLSKVKLERLHNKFLGLEIPQSRLNFDISRENIDDAWLLNTKLMIPDLTFKNISYQNFELIGSGKRQYQFNLNLNDPILKLNSLLTCNYNNSTVSSLKLKSNIENLNPSDFLESLPKQERKYDIEGELSLDRLDRKFKNLSFRLNKLLWHDQGQTEEYALTDLLLKLERNKKGDLYTALESEWARGSFKSNMNFRQFTESLKTYLYRRTPIIRHWGLHEHGKSKKHFAELDLQIDSLPKALNILYPIALTKTTDLKLQGLFNEKDEKLQFNLVAKELAFGSHRLDDLNFSYLNGNFGANADIHLSNIGELLGAKIELSQYENIFDLKLDLGIDENKQENGSFASKLELSSSKDKIKNLEELNLLVSLRPSNFKLLKEKWELSAAELLLTTQKVSVNGLKLKGKNRSVEIDGAISPNAQDSLHLKLNRMNLLYILTAANVNFKLLDADLTGDLYAKVQDKVFYAFGDVKSPHFFVDSYDAGASDLHLDWDSKSSFLGINGYLGDFGKAYTKANGGINIDANSGIDLMFTANKLKLGFVQAFTDSFLSKLEGNATGQVRLFGVFRNGVTIEGEADVENAEIGIKSLGTNYRFNDHLKFDADKMIFSNIKMTDDRGQTALFNGSISHNNFNNMDIQLFFTELNKFKVLDNQNLRVIPVLGKVYCTGSASLTGDRHKLLLKLDAKTDAPTDLSIDINALNTIWKDKSLMRFVNLRDSLPQTELLSKEELKKQSQSLLDLKLNLGIDAETAIAIRIGNNRSDEIKTRGEGQLQINVPFIGDQTIYGDFKLLSGDYNFRLENLTNKKFKIKEGSTINFRGNPTQTNVNIAAIYSLTANISDLDEGLSMGTRRTNMPVDCILGLNGSISRPKISFSIELPKASGEVERRLKSLLNNEEAMTKQTISLISLGKFMPSAYGKSTNDATNNWSALASTTISEQLSAILGDLSDKIQLGTNIKTNNRYFTNTDIELLFSGQLFNNRLLISGNVGYHDNPFLSNTYIGEFDLEYKLNKSGSLRLKAYNHYNNSYQYIRKGLTTQGFGVLFRKRFDSLSDLFRLHKKRGKSQ